MPERRLSQALAHGPIDWCRVEVVWTDEKSLIYQYYALNYFVAKELLLDAVFFFFNDTPPTEIYSLPLPAALPILPVACAARRCCRAMPPMPCPRANGMPMAAPERASAIRRCARSARTTCGCCNWPGSSARARSEEHTSELQSPCNLVCRLLLEKKKKHPTDHSLMK